MNFERPPKVAILMSCYWHDNSQHLRASLESLAAQEYPFDRMRLLLAIDGPIPESNRETIHCFRDCAPFSVLLVQIERNQGLANALNTAAKELAADEEYIFRADADDICAPDRLRKQVERMEAEGETGILGSAIEEFDNSGSVLGVRTYPRSREVREYICRASPLAHPTVVFRRNSFEQLAGYRSVAFNEDLDLWFRAVATGVVIDNMDEPLVRYRINDSFYSRRSWKKAAGEFVCYVRGINALFGPTWRMSFPVVRLLIRLSPKSVSRRIYGRDSIRRRMLNAR